MNENSDLYLRVSSLLEEVVKGQTRSDEAIACADRWTDVPWTDECFADAYHALKHFDADEDIRRRDSEYAEAQAAGLRSLAEKLRQRA